MTAREDEPESIQTSSVSLDLATASGPVQSAGLTSGPEFGGGFLEPDVGAVLLDQVGGVAHDAGIEDRVALGIVERRDRHAPGALARDAPVRAAFDGGFDAVLAPIGHPVDAVDLRQGALAELAAWSISMNHWSMARKMTGVLLRQQCG